MSLISLLVAIVILVLVLWVARVLLANSGLPANVRQIVYVVIVVAVVIWFLLQLTGTGPVVLR